MIKRAIQPNIEKYLKSFPAIVLLGPRQVGKTTLVKLISKIYKKNTHYLDLELSSDFEKLSRDPEAYLMSYLDECVIIDEVQRMPTLFPLFRALIDVNRKPARFIITGSASPALLKGASESLAGRVYNFQLNPLGLHEIGDKITIQKHWLRGGFPEALTKRNNDIAQGWLSSFITTYIERDLPFLFDTKFSPITMRKLWSMLAHLQSNILNVDKLGNSLETSGTTIRRYLDFLEGAFIITRLPPFFINISKRLVKAPKIYINDSGILHNLLRIYSEKELAQHPSVGASWEGYVVSQILYAKNDKLDLYYYRTHAGAECDLLIVQGHIVKACIEIKLSKAPVVTKGFYQSIDDLNCKNNFVICNTDADYITKEKVRIIGLKKFIFTYLSNM